MALFELGNITTTLLILRATELLRHGGRSATAAASLAIIVYAAHNLAASVVALIGGAWIDRRGPRLVLGAGAAANLLAYAGFALPLHAWPLLLVLFCLAGTGIGLAEPAESALVARPLPDRLRGSGFGLLGGLQSAGDFLSSATVGLLYTAVSPAAGLAHAAAWMGLAVAAVAWPVGTRRRRDTAQQPPWQIRIAQRKAPQASEAGAGLDRRQEDALGRVAATLACRCEAPPGCWPPSLALTAATSRRASPRRRRRPARDGCLQRAWRPPPGRMTRSGSDVRP